VNGKVIMYADVMTDSMKAAIEETERRRAVQLAYNQEHNIQPLSIYKAVRDLTDRVKVAEGKEKYGEREVRDESGSIIHRMASLPKDEQRRVLQDLEAQMRQAAKELEFEKAAMLRDQILELRMALNDIDEKTPEWEKVRRLGEEVAQDEMATEGAMGKPVTYKKPAKAARGGRKRR
jgi:excinuclease ABC subunit B